MMECTRTEPATDRRAIRSPVTRPLHRDELGGLVWVRPPDEQQWISKSGETQYFMDRQAYSLEELWYRWRRDIISQFGPRLCAPFQHQPITRSGTGTSSAIQVVHQSLLTRLRDAFRREQLSRSLWPTDRLNGTVPSRLVPRPVPVSDVRWERRIRLSASVTEQTDSVGGRLYRSISACRLWPRTTRDAETSSSERYVCVCV